MVEIRGLKEALSRARSAISGARSSVSGLEASAIGLQQDADDITRQLEAHRSDLQFEAQSLGNSPGSNGSNLLRDMLKDELDGVSSSEQVKDTTTADRLPPPKL